MRPSKPNTDAERQSRALSEVYNKEGEMPSGRHLSKQLWRCRGSGRRQAGRRPATYPGGKEGWDESRSDTEEYTRLKG